MSVIGYGVSCCHQANVIGCDFCCCLCVWFVLGVILVGVVGVVVGRCGPRGSVPAPGRVDSPPALGLRGARLPPKATQG